MRCVEAHDRCLGHGFGFARSSMPPSRRSESARFPA